MFDRRRFMIAVPALGAAARAGAGTSPPECAVFTRARQQSTSPDEALALLKEGNERFVAGRTVNCDLRAQVRDTASGQAPFATIVGCIDSRVPPELVFDQRIGDVFCARIAGNFVNDDILGSLEFATKLAGARLAVVLGHTECGAIKGAVDGAKLGYLTAMLRNFAPAIKASRGVPGEHTSRNRAFVQAVADANATLSAAQLVARSEVLRSMVEQGQLRIVSAMHDVATGRVTFFI
ncbi:carbonic anhydrase [Burkholderiales bacterium]|nr:carbonic anhydrase [Burkholderiales bacterium]